MCDKWLILLAAIALQGVAVAGRVRNNPIYGNTTIGYYYVDVFVGAYKQPQSLIIDTGSYNVIFPCKGCSKCGEHIYPYFDSANSTSFEALKPEKTYYGWKCWFPSNDKECNFYEGYVEGSGYSGIFGLDSLIFYSELNDASGTKETKAIFGCAFEETNEFYKQKVNGIMGLAPESRIFSKPPTILQIQLAETRISENSFSLCLGRNGGQIGFGGDNDETHVSEKTLTLSSANLSWDNFYFVNFDGMKVG